MILKLTPALLGGVMLQRALHFSSEPDNTTTKHGFFSSSIKGFFFFLHLQEQYSSNRKHERNKYGAIA
jgi:hypothetical protein